MADDKKKNDRPESDLEYQKRMKVGLYTDPKTVTKAGSYTDSEDLPKEMYKGPNPPTTDYAKDIKRSKGDQTGKLDSYKKGGKVKRTGPAYLHKGERVLNVSQAKKLGGGKKKSVLCKRS